MSGLSTKREPDHSSNTVGDYLMNRNEIADKLEDMCCNAPRAGCDKGRPCDCTWLMRAAKELRASVKPTILQNLNTYLCRLRIFSGEPERATDPGATIPTDLDSLKNGICPDCGPTDFLMGPRAGICENIQCEKCGSRFNIAMVNSRVFKAERI